MAIPAWRRPLDMLFSSRPVAAFLRATLHHLDTPMLKLSGGRFSLTSALLPTLLLTTTGRKSGMERTAPLLYLRHGQDYAIIGTRYGHTSHPGWVHNLRANPRARVMLEGDSFEVTAREAQAEEYDTLWNAATRLYGGYEKYRSRVGNRQIPILVLSRSCADQSESRPSK